MKSSLIKSFVLALATIVMCGSASCLAQGQAGIVAILDVAKVFKDNPTFAAQMEAIKTEAESLKNQITAEQEQIKQRAEGLAGLEIGSPDRNKLEADLELAQTNLRTRARQAEAELLNREARVYYNTYVTMQSVVESLAASNNISLVLRFDSEPIDASNRNEVIKGVNRAVVYHRKLDLTGMVTTQLNARMAQAGGGASVK